MEEDTQHYKTAIEAFGKDFEDDEDVDQVELELKELEKQEAEQRKRLEAAMNEFKSFRNEASKLKSEVSELKDKEYELEKEYATLKVKKNEMFSYCTIFKLSIFATNSQTKRSKYCESKFLVKISQI